MRRKNMTEPLEYFVKCEKCSHGARLYHNPSGGGIKSREGGPTVPITGSPDSTKFYGWVVAVCEYQQCKNFDKSVFLSEDDFKSLTPPPCPVCKEKMKSDRKLSINFNAPPSQRKGNYFYRCENNSHPPILLADLLPNRLSLLSNPKKGH
jgi:hypothetical protein